MAVRAANDAFVDFGLEGSRGRSAGDHSADVSEFRSANVIEVKHDNVVFIAVHARVTGKVLDHDSTISFRICEMKRISTSIVHG